MHSATKGIGETGYGRTCGRIRTSGLLTVLRDPARENKQRGSFRVRGVSLPSLGAPARTAVYQGYRLIGSRMSTPDLPTLIAALSRPEAYPQRVGAVEVRQTHISVVFRAHEVVYKIKKPVALGFLDFSTLEKRRHFCEEEVRLNRRLAPTVYLGVVPVSQLGKKFCLEGQGRVVEWAVKMQRLPADATLQRRLALGRIEPQLVCALASKIASFHKQANRGPYIASFGSFDVVVQNARENF